MVDATYYCIMRKCIIVLFCCILSVGTMAAKKRDLLQKQSKAKGLSEVLVSNNSWVNFPAYKDRAAWSKIPQEKRDEYIKQGEKYLDYNWPAVPASTYLDFMRTGSREVMQIPYRERQSAFESLVMAELMEGKGRFIDQIINGVWVYCEQTYWGLSAHLYMQKVGPGLPDVSDLTIDLGAGKVATDLAWTNYFFKEQFDAINPLISQRIVKEITDKVLTPYYTRDDMWWMAFNSDFVNNWNPWCNYNVLNCVMLIEKDNDKKIAAIEKTLRSVDQFINYYHEDGGCEEGPGYWGHAGGKLYDYLELVYEITEGKISLFDNSLVQNIGKYIYKAYIADPYFINFADAGARIHTRPGIIYSFGQRINDEKMIGFGSFLAKKYNWKDELFHGKIEFALANLFRVDELLSHESYEPLEDSFWMPGTEIMGARDKANTTNGFYFAAKGGYNNESHNHNDAGTFVLYYNGQPCLVDAGVGTYTRKTFSPERYTIWTMQSQYHNLPKVNGVDQANGKEYKATNCSFYNSKSQTIFNVDLTKAYPAAAQLKSWKRSMKLRKGKSFEVTDNYQLDAYKAPTSYNLLTCCKTEVNKNTITLKGEGYTLKLQFNPKLVTPKVESIDIKDNRLKKAWPQGLSRIVFTANSKNLTGKNVFTVKPE
ncbi:hypothetical protein EYV94_09370 [Puteibacter caeruleilacunae]|nr:hypothetical protein EYV94_09370 [Puteibacter caeruleilacunae]